MQESQTKARHMRDFYDWIDLFVKTFGTIIAVFALVQAVRSYQNDLNNRLLERRIKVFDDALTAAGNVVSAGGVPYS